MVTDIHHDLESWLAAAVHDQLSPEARAQFDEHLASCANCRALYEEELTMSKMIAATLEEAKPDLAFEQRIVSGFRKTVPPRNGLMPLLVRLFRLRATQFAAVAALLLALMQVGKVLTGEGSNQQQQYATALSAPPPPAERRAREEAQSATAAPQRYAVADAASRNQAGAVLSSTALMKARRTEATDEITAAPTQARQPAESSAGVAKEKAAETAPTIDANRKLVRNAQVEIEVVKFDDAVAQITAFASENRGYIATSGSEKQANGKLRGEVVVKVLPEKLDAFLLQLRALGEVKNQTLGTEDVSKKYFDTDARLKNARLMEQRLADILKTKTGKVSDLLEVERELGRVREQIEQMQGELKFVDAQVAFATVTIALAEKNMDVPAAFLLKRRATLALFSSDVEKTFAEVKGVIDGAKAQLASSTLDRDSAGEATAHLTLLIAREGADDLIARIKGMGRVQNFNEQTERVAQGGNGMAEGAKVERDKVQLS
ncbi:MAG: DUF4349 domain-containing protein, partial [Verrucomicrobiota bacterium]|nr:DUF4349 domain-containing protein [Verrucomicrobiota bacterium]